MSAIVPLALAGAVAGANPAGEPDGRKTMRGDDVVQGWNTESEAALALGVAWLSRQQHEDGSWEFDGSSKDRVAATGMALLPFVGVSEAAEKYKDAVGRGISWLIGQEREDGQLSKNVYAQALATIALCDASRLGADPKVGKAAARAVGYSVKAQGRNGSWGQTGPSASEGDTSLAGWQIQALTAARRAGIAVDGDVFKRADHFLRGVSTDDGAKYGDRETGASRTLTPVGLLSRLSMGTLHMKDSAVAKGVAFLKESPPQKEHFEVDYCYYATRVMILAGGDDWHRFWNPKMRDLLIDLRRTDDDPAVRGSWDKDSGIIGTSCGRLGTTALAALTLEVYYRGTPRKTLPPPKGAEPPAK
jgi:hypothetical protein